MANRITTIIDFVTDGASRQLSGFKAKIAEADTATGKMKAGFGAAGDFIKQNAASIATTAGAALVGFGVKSVQAFTETALAAGKFADATGLAVEDASRWVEVAGDVGVSTETVSGLFVRLNKAIGDNAPVVAQLGIEQKKLADGTTDVNATMIEAIKRINDIKDPTERAAAAQKLFGRGYKEAAEIIFTSADGLVEKLGEVSDAKVIDEEELDKARQFRATLDNLKDSLEDVTLVVGEQLVPILDDLGTGLTDIKDTVNDIPGLPQALEATARSSSSGIKALGEGLDFVTGRSDDAIESTGLLARAQRSLATEVDEAAMAAAEAAGATEALNISMTGTESSAYQVEAAIRAAKSRLDRFGDDGVETMNDVEDAVDDTTDAFGDLKAEIAGRTAWRDLETAFEDVGNAANAAWTAASEGADDAAARARDYDQSIDDARLAVIEYAEEVGDIPTDVMTKVMTEVDEGEYANALALLKELERERTIRLRIDTGAINGNLQITPGARSADGNYNTPGGLQTINDGNGGEIVTLPGGSKVMTHANSLNYLNQMGGGGDEPSVVYNNKTINQYIQVAGDAESVLYEAARRARYME